MPDADYAEWLGNDQSAMPAPCLPGDRRSFGQVGMACPARLYKGDGTLLGTYGVMERAAGRLVAGATGDRRPGTLPAGYTYFAQLLVHDLCKPTFGGVMLQKPRARTMRMAMAAPPPRRPGLMLDSILGAENTGLSPRGIYRFKGSAADPGRPIAVDLDRRHDPARGCDMAIVADLRNDDTPMLAQLSALFAAFFLTARARLARPMGADAEAGARALTVEVFHRLLRKDLLARLLHPDVARLYLRRNVPFTDPAAANPWAPVPIEATNAVLRFGHAMVRPAYLLNDRSQPPSALPDLMRGLSRLEAGRARNANLWRVDWRLFFGDRAQLAGRIGPAMTPGLVERDSLRIDHRLSPDLGWDHDLAFRDMARSADSGLQRVADLVASLTPHYGPRGWGAFDAGERAALMAGWPAEVAGDPPLGLFCLVEAGATGAGYGGGRTLGALGSLILAETVLAEIARGQEWLAREGLVRPARSAIFGTARLPATMTGFIDFMTSMA